MKVNIVCVSVCVCVCLWASVCVVVKSGHYCSLLEVVDKSRSTTSITKLLQELEIKRVVGCAFFNIINKVYCAEFTGC